MHIASLGFGPSTCAIQGVFSNTRSTLLSATVEFWLQKRKFYRLCTSIPMESAIFVLFVRTKWWFEFGASPTEIVNVCLLFGAVTVVHRTFRASLIF